MEKLIIVMLLCVICNVFADDSLTDGQYVVCENIDWEKVSYVFGKEDSASVTVYEQKVITNENAYIAASIIRLLQFYEEYEKECYADSSIVRLGKGWSVEINGKTTTEYWEHLEPTFQGYMGFLKKKFN